MFSRTLAHGNSKSEIRQLKIKGKKSRRKERMWKEAQWARKSLVNLNVKSHLSSSSHISHSRQSLKKSLGSAIVTTVASICHCETSGKHQLWSVSAVAINTDVGCFRYNMPCYFETFVHERILTSR